MKRIVALLMLLLVVACAKPAAEQPSASEPNMQSNGGSAPAMQEHAETQVQQNPSESEPAAGRTPPSITPPSEKVPAQTASQTETAPAKTELSPQIRDLLKRSQDKLTSMQYLYGGTDTGNLFLNTYLVRGDKMRIKPYEENYYVRDDYYDNVYVNLGVGCCEVLSRCKSHNVDNTGKKFDVDVSKLDIPKTPLEWLKDIKSNAIVVGPQTFNSRSVTHIKYVQDDGKEVLMWIDDTYGVPHKVEIQVDGTVVEKHQFNDLKFNDLKDADFDAPCD